MGESPRKASTFLNCFVTMHGEFLCQDFRPLGWLHSLEEGWWSVLIAFIMKNFKNQLMEIGLYRIVQAVQYGIQTSHFHFFSILELFNPGTWTFFTLIGEMGLALHELYKVSRLPMNEVPYEEYVSTVLALHLLKT